MILRNTRLSKMSKLPIKLHQSKIESFCKKHYIIYFALFGSVLTSNFSEKSDVDILVKFEKKHIPHLFSLVSMESELSEMIGYQVDLRTPNDLSIYFREDVLNRAKIIYGK